MLQNIKKIKKFGIFQDTSTSAYSDFGRYNLFFGWNGSGKSTLSSLFRCLETNTASGKFPDAEFSINQVDGASIHQNNLNDNNINLSVFNQDFINENISWNNLVKSILIIDKEKITDRELLEKLKKQQKKDSEEIEKLQTQYTEDEKALGKFATDSARQMKASLQSIDTSDKYYLNYDKRRLESFITTNEDSIKSGGSTLEDSEIIEHTNAAKPNQKNEIKFTPSEISSSRYSAAEKSLTEIFSQTVVSQTIKRLAENTDIKSWVETGLKVHSEHQSDNCEFCGQTLPEKRIKELEGHFNDNYKEFQETLKKANDWLNTQYLQKPQLPEEASLYDEFINDYKSSCESLNNAIDKINEQIAAWQKCLDVKIKNQLETNINIDEITSSSIDDYNKAMKSIDSVIRKHNHKTSNFEKVTKKSKKALELHYATTEVKNFSYYEKQKALEGQKEKNATLSKNISDRAAEIKKLEDSLSDESLGAEEFNKDLHKFLGRSDISLTFSPTKKGYEIIRNGKEPVNGGLSEGEKTAIAFVYFITKLYENDNKIDDTVIVIDDPISSFDSNHLFHAYSFLRLHCEKAKQLFILTHNFTYFKLIRDWIRKKNKQDKNNVSMFYTLKSSNETPRSSIINDADQALVLYSSEYHYIFSRLNDLRNSLDDNIDEHFLAANLSRKLLESFFSFKYPKGRGNFSNLFDYAITKSSDDDKDSKEKIRKFINEFSHNDLIETNEDFVQSLIGECANIVNDVFKWIEELDKDHYGEMIEAVA